MQVTIDNINYKFIPSKITDINSISKKKLTLKNDIYEKYEATSLIDGELIICSDSNHLRRFDKKIIRESFEDYLRYLLKRDIKKDQWIYNIIAGISEQESVLYRDELCLIIPTYMWDGKNIDKLHILCMPIDVSLRSIRSLNSSHISLLEHMKQKTIEIITNKYNLDEHYLKMFFHYQPSAYHLHIHFVNIMNHESSQRSSIEYSHELNSVIFNLSICDDYYQRAILNKLV
jgi:m7GpppX diphosphatase